LLPSQVSPDANVAVSTASGVPAVAPTTNPSGISAPYRQKAAGYGRPNLPSPSFAPTLPGSNVRRLSYGG
jgi:hypothetical protein